MDATIKIARVRMQELPMPTPEERETPVTQETIIKQFQGLADLATKAGVPFVFSVQTGPGKELFQDNLPAGTSFKLLSLKLHHTILEIPALDLSDGLSEMTEGL